MTLEESPELSFINTLASAPLERQKWVTNKAMKQWLRRRGVRGVRLLQGVIGSLMVPQGPPPHKILHSNGIGNDPAEAGLKYQR
ncbi:hypothetical protein J6590_030913 [Homalodisca vitripennis]|nr:hypothetical protein J6590_030913 [Homalodisca vitripennis]